MKILCPSCGYDNIEGMDQCENCMEPLRDLDVPRAEATAGLPRSVMEDEIGQLIQEEAITVPPGESAINVVRRIKEEHTGCALIVDGDKLAGIFTEHDALCKLTGAQASDPSVAISELMTRNPEALRETDSVAAALNKMSIGRYRHVPIIKKDSTYTVLSIKHVLKYIAQENW